MQITPAPLHIPAAAFMGWPAAAPFDRAAHVVTMQARHLEIARADYVAACAALGAATRRHNAIYGRSWRAGMFTPKSGAFRAVNLARRALRGAERAHADACAAQDATSLRAAA